MSDRESNDKLIKHLDKIDAEAQAARDENKKAWDKSLKHWRGDFWPDKRPSWKPGPVLNHAGALLERKVAYLTDAKPQIRVTARDERLEPAANVLTELVGALWEERDWTQALQELLFYAGIFRGAFASTIYNPELDMGYGDVDIVVGDPRAWGYDPFVLRSYDLDKGEYVMCERFETTEALRLRYPDAGEIPAHFESKEPSGWKSLIAKIFRKGGGGNREATPAIDRSLIKEYWLKDRTPRLNEQGEPQRDPERNNSIMMEYPGGRHILRVGNVILSSQSNPYIDGIYSFPVDMLAWRFDPDGPMGMSELEILSSGQEIYNKIVEIIVENAILMTNAIWIGDETALSPKGWERLSSKPGLFVQKRPGTDLHRETAPGLPAYLQAIPTAIKQDLAELSGMTDVTRGIPQGGVTSGVALDSLQQAAQATIRLMARSIETFLSRVGQKLIARVLQYYTSNRVIHLLGDTGEVRSYRFIREELMGPLKAAYGEPPSQGTYMALARRAMRDFRFRVVPGSSLSLAKVPQTLLAMTLHAKGVIDDETLIDAVPEFPGREQARERARVRAQMGIPARANGNERGVPGGMPSIPGVPTGIGMGE